MAPRAAPFQYTAWPARSRCRQRWGSPERLRRCRGRSDWASCRLARGSSASTSKSPTRSAWGGRARPAGALRSASSTRKGAASEWLAHSCHHTRRCRCHSRAASSGPRRWFHRAGTGRSGAAGKLCSRLAEAISCSRPTARGRLQRDSSRAGTSTSNATLLRVRGSGKTGSCRPPGRRGSLRAGRLRSGGLPGSAGRFWDVWKGGRDGRSLARVRVFRRSTPGKRRGGKGREGGTCGRTTGPPRAGGPVGLARQTQERPLGPIERRRRSRHSIVER